MEFLLNIDIALLYFINVKLANPMTNLLMPVITNFSYWLPVYIPLLIYLLWKGGTRGRIAVVALLLTVLISDQLSSSVLKELFGRIRPCHVFSDLNLLVGCGAGKSFPSSHAVNNFAEATVISFFYKKYRWIFFSIASLIALSRVFVGVHYPSDILGGALIGTGIGYIIIKLTKNIIEKYKLDL